MKILKQICIMIIVFLMFVSMAMKTDVMFAQDVSNKLVFDFEGSKQKWKIPDWAFYQGDHVGKELFVSQEKSSKGDSSLALMCDFPGDRWAAAIVNIEETYDFSNYTKISAEVYLPKKAPRGLLQARIILTIGDGWHFTEMRYAEPLKRGKWTKIEAYFPENDEDTSQWKGRKKKHLAKHINNIQKIAVRIEYDVAPPHRLGPRYEGPVYIDNVVVE